MSHHVHIYREKKWPGQWIGQCSCGRGIRCNSREDAEAFFMREGCFLYAVAGGAADQP